jgi:selenocysteine lyase/cysteine desulfurase
VDKGTDDIRKFEEIGTHSSATRLSIGEALLFHQAIGAKRKEERLRYLSSYWMDRLGKIENLEFNTSFDPDQYCAIVNFSIHGTDPVKLAADLQAKHRIITAPFVHREFSGIRITPNIFTRLSELDRFCDAVEGIARGRSSSTRAVSNASRTTH